MLGNTGGSGGFGLHETFGAPAPSANLDFGSNGVGGGGNSSGFADFGNWAAGAQALGSLVQGWAGLRAASAAKEQNRIAEMFGRANYDVSAKSFNERLETRGRSRRNRASFDSGGQSLGEVLSRYGARSLDGNTVVGSGEAASSNSKPSAKSSVSPTASLPETNRSRASLT